MLNNHKLNSIAKFRTVNAIFAGVSIFATALILISFFSATYAATPNSVVINEIMYNPLSGVDGDEFLELYNVTASPIDLSGWCFTNGISLCFAPGTIISGNGYAVVSPDAVRTQSTYGVTTAGTYTGKLDNGGEKVTLKDELNTTISSYTYDDASPWPISPDGYGPSLELLDATTDITLSTSWRGSLLNGGSPGAINSVTNPNTPVISDVAKLTGIAPSTIPIVTAHVDNATSVTLVYKVMFDAEQVLTMYDDGVHSDGASGDGIYGGEIPAQIAGTMVRYRVSATNGNGTVTIPGNDDSIKYLGYSVNDGTSYAIPEVRWYIDPNDYTEMTTNHLNDDQQFPAIVAVGDQFFDGAQVRVKGESSTSFPKRKYKFDLPSGYTLGAPVFDIPVKEFSLQVYFLNQTDLQEGMAWKAFEKFGFPVLQNRYVRLNRNIGANPSEYFGHYLIIENYDKAWRERNGYEEGALYKQGDDKKTRLDEDNSDIQDLQIKLATLKGDELKNYLLDNINIPALINYNALSAVITHNDWLFIHNIYEYRDTEGTERWEYLPWDLDNALTTPALGGVNMQVAFLKEPDRSLIEMEDTIVSDFFPTDPTIYKWAIIEGALYQFPEFREMFFRRSMNMYDQIWANNQYELWFDEFNALSRDSMADDLLVWNPAKQSIYHIIFPDGWKWPIPDDFPLEFDPDDFFNYMNTYTPEDSRALNFYGANRYRSAVNLARSKGQLLGIQTSEQESQVQINEIHYHPQTDETTEFIELHNNSDHAVDISKWELEGIKFTLPQGSVLPANGYGVVVANDKAFRAAYPSVLVFGEYSGKLSNNGETITLKNTTGSTVSSVTYGTNGSWPSSSDGQGYSLSLIRDNANETLSACWAPSLGVGGTPGQVNTFDTNWVQEHGSGCTDRNYQEAQNNSNTALAETGTNALVICFVGMVMLIGASLYRSNYKT
jgi:hypothetical protein